MNGGRSKIWKRQQGRKKGCKAGRGKTNRRREGKMKEGRKAGTGGEMYGDSAVKEKCMEAREGRLK